jgi:hypothetical protein
MKYTSFTLISILLLLLASCAKVSTENKTNTSPPGVIPPVVTPPVGSSTTGFGYSTKALTGTPYFFPSGVLMRGSFTTESNTCTVWQSSYECSTDGTLPFYVSLNNTNPVPTRVIFPAGFVIPSTDSTLQGAVLVQPDTITIAPSSSLCVNLYAMCVNEYRTFSFDQNYAAPLISNNANLNPLIQLLATKQTVTYDPNEVIQQAVWDIANTGAMTPSDIAAIRAFP